MRVTGKAAQIKTGHSGAERKGSCSDFDKCTFPFWLDKSESKMVSFPDLALLEDEC